MSRGRRGLLVAALLVLGHAGALELAAHADLVSALLSPGAHSRFVALGFGASFLVLRLICLVVLPAVVPSFLVFLGISGLMGLRRRP